MSGKRLWLLGWVLASCLLAGAAAADEDREAPRGPVALEMGGDRFVAGGEVEIGRPVDGDLLVIGGNADVDAGVAGDLLAVGGQLRVAGDVGGSMIGAAGQMTVDGKVGRNLRVAGGRVELGPRAVVGGNVSVGAGSLRLRGSVRGQVLAGGGRVMIDGPVGGDVVVAGGELDLGPNARIAGSLRYRSGRELRQDPQAQVAGGIERLPLPPGREKLDEARHEAGAAAAGLAGLLWTLGLVVLAALWIGLLPQTCRQVTGTLRARPGASLLLGFALLVCVPVAVVLLLATLVGVPAALVALALYLALLPLAYVVAAIGLGESALRRWWPLRADRPMARVAAAAAVLVVLSGLGWVPLLGALPGLLVLLAGLGAVALQVRRAPLAP
jgi:cytoskeletal protein CcmA (bactofilin family)